MGNFIKRFEFSSTDQIPSGLPPIGVAGGDLSGTYPNPTVSKLLGNSIPANANGYLLNDGSGNLSWNLVSGGGVTSFNTRTGAITLTSSDVTTALGYTPYNSTNPSGYITSSTVAAGYLPINNPAYTGILSTGTLGYSTTNLLESLQSSVNSFNQLIIQNSNNGSIASTDLVVSNDIGTNTTFYGNFGMNSSGFTGSGSFNQPSYVYLTSTSSDLAIGTTTSNNIHFIINGGITDTALINSTGLTVTGSIIKSGGTSSQFLKADGSIDSNTYLTSTGIPFSDASALIKNSSDTTKLAIFSAASITTATTRTFTLPDVSTTIVGKTGTAVVQQIPFYNDANQITTDTNFSYKTFDSANGGRAIYINDVSSTNSGNNFLIGNYTAAFGITVVNCPQNVNGSKISFRFKNGGDIMAINNIPSGFPQNYVGILNGLYIGATNIQPSAKFQIANNFAASPLITGSIISVLASTINDTATAGTAANCNTNAFGINTYTATNARTYSDVANVYIAGANTASTNVTFTRNMALWVGSGWSRFDGTISIGTTNNTALLTLGAGTASANTSPFKFTRTGSILLTSPEDGANEVDTVNLYHTIGTTRMRITGTGLPTIVAGVGAGSSPTVSISGNDGSHQVSILTGATPTGTNAVVATITFNKAFGTSPKVVFSPANAATALLSAASMIYMDAAASTTTYVITSGTTALTTLTTYLWNVHVQQ